MGHRPLSVVNTYPKYSAAAVLYFQTKRRPTILIHKWTILHGIYRISSHE